MLGGMFPKRLPSFSAFHVTVRFHICIAGKNKIKITYGTEVLPHMLASFIALCNSFEDNIVEDLQIQDLLEAWSLLGVLVPAALDKLSEFLGARVGNLRSFVSV
jgi:hypothetical protein